MAYETSKDKLRRAPVVCIYDVGDTTVVVGRDGSAHELTGDSAHLCRAVLSFVTVPRSAGEIFAHVAELTGGPIEDTSVIDELLELLSKLEVLAPVRSDARPFVPAGTRTRLVLCVSGAIAAAHTPALVALLQKRGFDVRIAATDNALRFTAIDALEALVHHPVLSEMWPEEPGLPVPHINLAQWADVVLVSPATATTISRLATGDYSTLVSAIAMATSAPVVVVPSMNAGMYGQPAVRRNMAQLTSDGLYVVHPATGLEVADPPDQRRPMLGPAPPHLVIVQIVQTILRVQKSAAPQNAPVAPRDAGEWDAVYRQAQAAELPWHTEVLDTDIARALDSEAPEPVSVLDIGTGLGLEAIEAARRGHRVVATDISEAALRRAREASGETRIIWLRDDITDSALQGNFDVVVDRGCLHLLPADQLAGYAASVTRLTVSGGVLLLKTHDPSVGNRLGTTPYAGEDVRSLLGTAFELLSETETTFPGPRDAPAARLFVLRRRRETGAK